jgi:hypothetical protein
MGKVEDSTTVHGNIPLVWPVEWVALGSQQCFYFGLIFAFVFRHHEEYEINKY